MHWFFIITIPFGLSVTIFIFRNENLKKIAKSIDSDYSGYINNTFDFIRLIKIYYGNEGSKEDIKFIRDSLFLIIFSWLMVLIAIILFVKQW